uniref:Grh/CP2 DB domain-containing protein n=1 Tax=Glossina palpalis gambiensis TaxID=67801 RepID=A0A1B0BGD4_9MUSC
SYICFHSFSCGFFFYFEKGAERKTRDEERRAAKRKMTATGRKKLDELYHPVTDRSEFYSMQDLLKPPVLFSPADDLEKVRIAMNSTIVLASNNTETTTTYNISTLNSPTNTNTTSTTTTTTDTNNPYNDHHHNHHQNHHRHHHHQPSSQSPLSSQQQQQQQQQQQYDNEHCTTTTTTTTTNATFGHNSQGFYGHETDGAPDLKGASPFLLHGQKVATPTLKFHNHFPPDMQTDKKDHILDQSLGMNEFGPALKRGRMTPPTSERVMLYVRQENEDVYTPLHVVPPTTIGLLNAIESKYKISTTSINNVYKKNKKGIKAKMDDDMISYYCNEDIFVLEVLQITDELYDIFLQEETEH